MKFTDKNIIIKKIRLNKAIVTRTKTDIIKQAFFYKHISADIMRNFSSTTEPSNEIGEVPKFDNGLDLKSLQKLTIEELRKLAKKKNINLKSQRTKKEIISQINLYFSNVNTSSDLETLQIDFEMRSDEKGRIDISLWFRSYKKKLGFNALKRFLTSNQIDNLRKVICERENLEHDEIINKSELGTFVHPQIALQAAAYLNKDIDYDICKFYLVAQPAEIEKQIKKQAQEKVDFYIKELGIKLNQHVNWDKFNIPFAYYLIEINNTVKAGIVGQRKNSRTESLDSRLAVHRSTYARFKLINVFEFREATTVMFFENVTKHALSEHRIKLDRSMRLEQYECRGKKNSSQIINEVVSEMFKKLRFEDEHLGMECPKEKIDDYNKTSLKRLVPTVLDNFEEK